MRPKSTLPLVFLVAAACAGAAPPPPAPAARGTEPARAALPQASPAEVLAEADEAYASRLAAARGRFDTERQIGVLEEAILLYSQFLERAEGRPELEPAVRKSRERIADARETIVFLRASLAAQGEPPLAPSP